jgi:voltage-gated potassium channel
MRVMNRPVDRFLKSQLSIRNAARVIIVATIVTVLAGGAIVYVFDRRDFPDLGLAMWWALQTVTTVGYGDIVPESGLGKCVGAVVMIESIAFLSIITASITSIFVERARREREVEAGTAPEDLRAALATLTDQVASLEATLRSLRPADPDGPITSSG